jgi:hypothetical protein
LEEEEDDMDTDNKDDLDLSRLPELGSASIVTTGRVLFSLVGPRSSTSEKLLRDEFCVREAGAEVEETLR